MRWTGDNESRDSVSVSVSVSVYSDSADLCPVLGIVNSWVYYRRMGAGNSFSYISLCAWYWVDDRGPRCGSIEKHWMRHAICPTLPTYLAERVSPFRRLCLATRRQVYNICACHVHRRDTASSGRVSVKSALNNCRVGATRPEAAPADVCAALRDVKM